MIPSLDDVASFPPPPPWVAVQKAKQSSIDSSRANSPASMTRSSLLIIDKSFLDTSSSIPMVTVYLNQVTGEETEEHPLVTLLKNVTASYKNTVDDNGVSNYDIDLNSVVSDLESFSRNYDLEIDESVNHASKPIQCSNENKNKRGGDKYEEFLCLWREYRLLGGVNSYCLKLRYFSNTKRIDLLFEGVEACWSYPEGLHNGKSNMLVDENDLFLGSQLNIFGRHISITSASADICMAIDLRAEALLKRRAWLQGKIELVGAIPVIRRDAPTAIRNIVRHSNHSGRSDLRKLININLKLQEQLVDLGLSHVLLPASKSDRK